MHPTYGRDIYFELIVRVYRNVWALPVRCSFVSSFTLREEMSKGTVFFRTVPGNSERGDDTTSWQRRGARGDWQCNVEERRKRARNK